MEHFFEGSSSAVAALAPATDAAGPFEQYYLLLPGDARRHCIENADQLWGGLAHVASVL